MWLAGGGRCFQTVYCFMVNNLNDTSQTSLFASAKVLYSRPLIMGIDGHAYDSIVFHVIRCVEPHADLADDADNNNLY